MYKKIFIIATIPILIALLVGSIWFVGNLIAYNKCWDGLSPAVRDEWESTGESGGNRLSEFIKHGLNSGCPAGLDDLREPEATILNLQDNVQQLELNQRALQGEVDALRKAIAEREEADRVAEIARQKVDSQTQR